MAGQGAARIVRGGGGGGGGGGQLGIAFSIPLTRRQSEAAAKPA